MLLASGESWDMSQGPLTPQLGPLTPILPACAPGLGPWGPSTSGALLDQ